MNVIELNTEVPYKLVFMLIIGGIIFLWLSLILWVWFDSKSYFKSIIIRLFFSLTTTVFGFIGLSVYLLFRYGRLETVLDDQSDYNLNNLRVNICHMCNAINSDKNHFCKKCGFKLQKQCKNCNNFVSIHDEFCFECGAMQKVKLENSSAKIGVAKNVQLRYIKSVFSSTFVSLKSFFTTKKSKNHKNKKHKAHK